MNVYGSTYDVLKIKGRVVTPQEFFDQMKDRGFKISNQFETAINYTQNPMELTETLKLFLNLDHSIHDNEA